MKPGTDFDEYETYRRIEGAHVPRELSHQRIVSAVENELAIKGCGVTTRSPISISAITLH